MALGRALLQNARPRLAACDMGRIQSNGLRAKPARDVHAGDILQIENEGGRFEIEVLALSEMRGPAVRRKTLYRETESSREARLNLPKSAKPCSNSRRCPSAGPPSATAAASFSFAAECRSPELKFRSRTSST